MKKSILIVTLLFLIPFITHELNAQKLDMVKAMISQFDELQSREWEEDEIIYGTVPVPLESKVSKEFYDNLLDEPENYFKLSDLQNGYLEVNGKEYPTNSVSFEFSFLSMPFFQSINAWFEDISIRDLEGNDLLMKEKDLQKYYDLGIIDDGFAFPFPGSCTQTLWLNRELAWEEELIISGKLMIEFPSDYDLVWMTDADIMKEFSVGSMSYTLIDIENNMATLLQKGDRRAAEEVTSLYLNKDDKCFGSNSSIAIDADLYDLQSKSVKSLSDEDIQKNIDRFSMSNVTIEQVRKVQVNGKLSKLVFMKINSPEMLSKEFHLNLIAGY